MLSEELLGHLTGREIQPLQHWYLLSKLFIFYYAMSPISNKTGCVQQSTIVVGAWT